MRKLILFRRKIRMIKNKTSTHAKSFSFFVILCFTNCLYYLVNYKFICIFTRKIFTIYVSTNSN